MKITKKKEGLITILRWLVYLRTAGSILVILAVPLRHPYPWSIIFHTALNIAIGYYFYKTKEQEE